MKYRHKMLVGLYCHNRSCQRGRFVERLVMFGEPPKTWAMRGARQSVTRSVHSEKGIPRD